MNLLILSVADNLRQSYDIHRLGSHETCRTHSFLVPFFRYRNKITCTTVSQLDVSARIFEKDKWGPATGLSTRIYIPQLVCLWCLQGCRRTHDMAPSWRCHDIQSTQYCAALRNEGSRPPRDYDPFSLSQPRAYRTNICIADAIRARVLTCYYIS